MTTGNRLDDVEETDGPLEVVTDMVGLSDRAKEMDGPSDEEMDMDGRLSDGTKEMDELSNEEKETDKFLNGTKRWMLEQRQQRQWVGMQAALKDGSFWVGVADETTYFMNLKNHINEIQ